MEKRGKILIIDDNEDILFALNALLQDYVVKIKVSAYPEKIEQYLRDFQPDVILLDMNFKLDVVSGNEGFFWLEKILRIDKQAIVVFMTAYANTERAVQAIKAGAADFISKPWEKDKLLATILSAIKLKESQKEMICLKNKIQVLNTNHLSCEIIGQSEKMKNIFEMIDKLADTDANILILGENGTGKDLIAKAIHHHSQRAKEIFVCIDIGSISENIFESELFGYDKGAFTDAKNDKPGRMEAASGGTLFLDEIANMSFAMQSKMLTAIEKKNITRLGSTKDILIDVRYICATNANIYQSVEDGMFRRDLLYRINTIEIHVPPLRDRGGDIILLADYFLQKFNHKYRKGIQVIAQDAKEKLLTYSWPGNVRELQSVMERAVILSSSKILKNDDFILSLNKNRNEKRSEILNLEILELNAIENALKQTDGNLNQAAELLGISRFSLYRKMNRK